LYFDSFTKKKSQKNNYAIVIPYPGAIDHSWDEDLKTGCMMKM
jgi:hypothetical protein